MLEPAGSASQDAHRRKRADRSVLFSSSPVFSFPETTGASRFSQISASGSNRSCSKHSSAAARVDPAFAKSDAARVKSPRRRKKRAVSAALFSHRTDLSARRAASPSMPCRVARRMACPNRPAFEKYAIASPIASRASKARAKWNADAARTCSRLGPAARDATGVSRPGGSRSRSRSRSRRPPRRDAPSRRRPRGRPRRSTRASRPGTRRTRGTPRARPPRRLRSPGTARARAEAANRQRTFSRRRNLASSRLRRPHRFSPNAA